MDKVIFLLIWSLFSSGPYDAPKREVHPYSTEEMCEKDGNKLSELSAQMVEDKQIARFDVVCVEIDEAVANKIISSEKRGST